MLTLIIIFFVLNFTLMFVNYIVQNYKTALFSSFAAGLLLSDIIDIVLKNTLI